MRRLRTTGWALAAAGLIALAVMAAGRIAATAGDGVSPALAADTVLERIALASCADQKRPQPLWASIRDADPQLLLMIGDNVYGDVSGSDMRELKAAYARFATVDGFRRARETTPIMAIWDDHDYGRNDGGADFAFKQQAAELFRTFWLVPPDSERARREGLYDAAVFGRPGRRVQVILLDARWFRSPLRPTDERGAAGKERYLPDSDPAKTMLGAAQWAWLEAQLQSPAEFRLIVSSIQVLADGHGWERWGNLPLERRRLFDVIAETRAGGVILVSGDRHVGALYRRDDVLPYPLYEITSSSLNRPFPGAQEAGPHRLGDLYGGPNFGMVSVDWNGGVVTLEVRDSNGRPVRTATIDLGLISGSRD